MKLGTMGLAAALAGILGLGLGPAAEAGNPIVKICWEDNFSSLWVLDIAGFGSESFQIQGYRVSGPECEGGATRIPVTGGLVVGTPATFGATTIATGESCEATFWQGVINLSTGEITGSVRGLSGETAEFSMTPVACPTFSGS